MSLKQNIASPIITSWCRAILLYYTFLLPPNLYTRKEKKLQNKSPIPLRLVMSSDFHYSRCYLFPSYSLHGRILPIN